jgi:predicted helicase
MITVKVTYTVHPAFVAQNQENINRFMNEFSSIDSDEFRYTVYLCGDGKTFVHLSQYQNEDIQKYLLDVPSFKLFQQQRDRSGLESAPQIEAMKVVAASHEVFS